MERLLAVFLLSLIALVSGECSLAGCNPQRTFASYATCGEYAGLKEPLLVKVANVSSNSSDLSSVYATGCLANSNSLVCTYNVETQNAELHSKMAAWDLSNLTDPVYVANFEWHVSLPVMNNLGSVIASDGYSLAGYRRDGTPLGPRIPLAPINGDIYDLSLTENQIIILLYESGFLAGYEANGVPFVSRWLHDKINGTSGTFHPMGTPAMHVRQDRIFFPALFVPTDSKTSNLSWHVVRIYAIDFEHSMTGLMHIVWTYDYLIPLSDNAQPSAFKFGPNHSLKSETPLLRNITLYAQSAEGKPKSNVDVIVAFNIEGESYTLGINEEGKNFSLLFAFKGSDFGPEQNNKLVQSVASILPLNALIACYFVPETSSSQCYNISVEDTSVVEFIPLISYPENTFLSASILVSILASQNSSIEDHHLVLALWEETHSVLQSYFITPSGLSSQPISYEINGFVRGDLITSKTEHNGSFFIATTSTEILFFQLCDLPS